jgi:hypothetical protein
MTDEITVPPNPDGFETFADAKKRRAQKIRILSRGNGEQQRLATKLERCRKDNRCESGACDVCLRLNRLHLYRRSQAIFSVRPDWTRASVIPAGLLVAVGDLSNAGLAAIASMIDKRLERSSLCNRLALVGVDISHNLQDNQSLGWQLHLYMLVEGKNTLRLREAIKAAFPPEQTAPVPFQFQTVNDCAKAITYLFKAIFKRRSRYTAGNGQPRTRSLPLKDPELRELLQFLDRYAVGERLVLRGIRRNGRRFTIIKKQPKASK